MKPINTALLCACSTFAMLTACGGGGAADGSASAATLAAGTAADSVGTSSVTGSQSAGATEDLSDLLTVRTTVTAMKAGLTNLPALGANLARLYSGNYDLLDLPTLVAEAVALDRDAGKPVGTHMGNVVTNATGGVTPPNPDTTGAPSHAGCVKTSYGAACVFSLRTVTLNGSARQTYAMFGLVREGNGYTWSARGVQEKAAVNPAANPAGGNVFTGTVTMDGSGVVTIRGEFPPAIGDTGKLAADLTYTATTTGGSTTRTLTTEGYVYQFSDASNLSHGLTLAKGTALTRVDSTTAAAVAQRKRSRPASSAFKGAISLATPGTVIYAGDYTVSAYSAPDANGRYLPAAWGVTDLEMGLNSDLKASVEQTARARNWTLVSAAKGVAVTYDQLGGTGTVTRFGKPFGTIAGGRLTFADGSSTNWAF